MRRLNRDTDYAVGALLEIARKPSERMPVSELAARLKIPNPFLRKIFQTLQKERVVISSKGKGGGFVLTAAPREISLTRDARGQIFALEDLGRVMLAMGDAHGAARRLSEAQELALSHELVGECCDIASSQAACATSHGRSESG